ncbi:hypothetical protein SEA_NECROPOLIS_73 [Mycobacterium phage Necropolis]|uniref:Uncharacterized protein n=1 Tax=Mycobacterium phage Fishburne TaxID=1327765 RepID=R4TPF9_9CAUD|nr:hypothetical protein PBI_FISHBURNE_74 [Mycobacterium phage Fishburne]AGM12962.1 hypothetical protein PBI_FISHBURNE_74 [Mycobacterium phage Fishburne]QBI98010.1 hypothetical protein SEA_ZILIZEBETH_80 [Mycobacterium phage Zilizebeth]QDH92954.1 hypothetical protein SEA_NECROPOLIS_73 [Mycobacterium phage Necropolis]
MRKRIALALIKLAHKVYPPKITETLGDDGQPVEVTFDRIVGMALDKARNTPRPKLPNAATAAEVSPYELGVEMANRSLKFMSDAAAANVSGIALGPDPDMVARLAAEERIAKARRDAYSFDSYREQLDKMRAARNPINRKGLGPLTELRYDE